MSAAADSLLLKFKPKDTRAGVTRDTLRAIAEELGIAETAAVHMALAMLAGLVVPAYEADDGPLTASDVARMRKSAAAKMPKGKRLSSERLF
jgi:hypothetical protein